MGSASSRLAWKGDSAGVTPGLHWAASAVLATAEIFVKAVDEGE